MDLEKKVAELEARIKKLETCRHDYGHYQVYFNGCNAYHKCIKCGKRLRC